MQAGLADHQFKSRPSPRRRRGSTGIVTFECTWYNHGNSMEENVTSTNSLTNPGAGDVVSHLPSWLQPEWLRIALIVILAPLIYYLMLSLGRRLKRRHGVKLGILYHAFSLGCGIFFPAALLEPRGF